MARLVCRRLLTIPLTLLAVSLLVFLATEVMPGDVARVILGREANQASVDALRQQLHLDDPLPVRYLRWLGGFVTGDWGRSHTLGVAVRPLVTGRLLDSALLALFAFVLLVPSALMLGLLAGLREGRPTDRALSVTMLGLGAIPEFVTGVVLLVVFTVQLRWLPSSAQAPPGAGLATRLEHLLLPAVSLVLLCTGYVARQVRAGTVAALASPFLRAARVRGMSEPELVRRHVLRNAIIPATSALAVQLQFLLAGLVTVELLFGYPGVGDLLLTSATSKDVPTLQATAVVLGAAGMLVYLLADVVHALLDPRVRVGGAGR